MIDAQIIIKILWVVLGAHIVITWVLAIRRGWRARISELKQPEVPESELPGVSVIVPAWNEKGTIERNIAALKQVEYPEWEAIMVMGGMDSTYEAAKQAIAEDERFCLLERGPEPKNVALARGIEQSKYEIVVLLDCDNMVTPKWLWALMEPFTRGASVAVGNSQPNRSTWVTWEEQMWNTLTYQVLRLSWIQGDRSIAIKKELLERIGGLPTHTYAREDWDIWARLGETGEKVVFVEGAQLTTDRPATLAEHWKHQVRWRRTHLNGMWEHRAKLLKQPVELLRQAYGYLMSVGVLLLILLTMMISIFLPKSAFIMLNILGMAVAWLLLRQAALAATVAAFTGDRKWLSKAWMPALNLFITIPASVMAMATFTHLEPYYKGARHVLVR
jgi:cellulose synthase/poly-beta-1,6-N-acetylglucosamine synthase-like glycosyltransferase